MRQFVIEIIVGIGVFDVIYVALCYFLEGGVRR